MHVATITHRRRIGDLGRAFPRTGSPDVVTGGGGGGLRPVGTSKFHFVQFEVDPDRLVMHAIDTAGVEFDTVEIPRQ